MSDGLVLNLRVAESRGEVLRCRRLIAGVYNRDYEVVFSDEGYDLEAKVEPWPHRYLMVFCGGELAAATGLYVSDTYVERFGDVAPDEFQAVIDRAGAGVRYSAARMHEVTKVSVHHDFRGLGIGRVMVGAAHSKRFAQLETDPGEPAVIVMCAKLSIYRNLWDPCGIGTRLLKPFPIYRVHERYASPEDPMESRMIIPELDVPDRWFELELPTAYEVER